MEKGERLMSVAVCDSIFSFQSTFNLKVLLYKRFASHRDGKMGCDGEWREIDECGSVQLKWIRKKHLSEDEKRREQLWKVQ